MSCSDGGAIIAEGANDADAVKVGKHDKHVPRTLWRQMQEEKEKNAGGGGGGGEKNRDPLHVFDVREVGYGKRGGPAAAREVAGVMRSQAELERASPRNLQRMGLSSEEAFFARQARQEKEKLILDAFLRDGATHPDDKHHATAVFHMTWGRAYNNCPKCWLLRGCCICHLLTSSSVRPHRVVVYLHHQEWGRGSSTGNLVKECIGGELFVSGHRAHEAALTELCEREKGRVAVLWPGDDAIDARDIARAMPLSAALSRGGGSGGDQQPVEGSPRMGDSGGEGEGESGRSRGGENSGGGGGFHDEDDGCGSVDSERGEDSTAAGAEGPGAAAGEGRGYTFIAVDATWNCARKMLRRLPSDLPLVSVPPEAFNPDYEPAHHAPSVSSIPAVSADPVPVPVPLPLPVPIPVPVHIPEAPVASLLAPVRKYKGHPDGRCSTFEAVVALLRTLGHPRGECDALLDNVRTTVDAVKMHTTWATVCVCGHYCEVQKSMPSVYGTVTGEDDFVRKEAATAGAGTTTGVNEAMQEMKVL